MRDIPYLFDKNGNEINIGDWVYYKRYYNEQPVVGQILLYENFSITIRNVLDGILTATMVKEVELVSNVAGMLFSLERVN